MVMASKTCFLAGELSPNCEVIIINITQLYLKKKIVDLKFWACLPTS